MQASDNAQNCTWLEKLKRKSETAITAETLDDQFTRWLRVLSDHNVSNNGVCLRLGTTLHSVTLACTSAILQGFLRRLRILHVLAVEVRLTTCVAIDCVKRTSVSSRWRHWRRWL